MIPEPRASAALARVPRPDPLELDGLGGPLEDLLAGHAVAQDLAGRRRVAGPVDVAPAELERADRRAPRRSGSAASRPRTRSAAPRSRGTRRSAACSSRVARARIRTFGQRYGPPAWSAPRDRTTGRERAVRAAVHDDLDRPGRRAGRRGSRRSGGGRSPGGAWSSRRCPRGGRRSSGPGARLAARGARRGAR